MKSTPQHFYLASSLVFFRREDSFRERHINTAMELPNKKITQEALNNLKGAVQETMLRDSELKPQDLLDAIILNISYLGFMTREEFQGEK